MRNWRSLAQAHGLDLPAHELDRIADALAALEKTFHPLVADLTPDMEPDVQLRLPEDDE